MTSKELNLTRGGIPIRAWLYFPEPAHGRLPPLLVFCHGIPGSRPDPTDRGYLPLFEELTSAGYACATFNFRGCGLSGGDIDMRGWQDDMETVFEALSAGPSIDADSIHCIAFSAGGSVAARVVSYHPEIKSLLMMASPQNFADILPGDPAVLRDHFLSLGLIRDPRFPPDLDRWYRGFLEVEPSRWLPFVHPRPVGIVHGTCDETVPVSHAKLLHRSAWEPKRLILLEGAVHQLRKDSRTQGVIRDWLKEVV